MKMAVYARISMSGSACDEWLASPVKHIDDWSDWQEMSPTSAREHAEWIIDAISAEHVSVEEHMEHIADETIDCCFEYDEDRGAFFAAYIMPSRSASTTASFIAALRGVESFKDDDEPSFIYAFPADAGGDPEALLEITQGSSRFLAPSVDSPAILYFVNEAEEFIDDMMDMDDGD